MEKSSQDKQGSRPLSVEHVAALLCYKSPLSANTENFEERPEQQKMLRDVVHAYNHNKIALIEAGTGTGKSLAYLLPAVLWAMKNQERTVISTNTINLQEQLLTKDLPHLLTALGLNLHVALMKGMNNYLCPRRLEDAILETATFSESEAREILAIEAWKDKAHEGSRSELPMATSHATWDKVSAQADACQHKSCPHYESCPFFQARRKAGEAQIIVVNHHLLFADLAKRAESGNYQEDAIIPSYSRLILDEAHNIEDIATEHFASKVSRLQIMRAMAALMTERGTAMTGKLALLQQMLHKAFPQDLPLEVQPLSLCLTQDLPASKREVTLAINEAFDALAAFAMEGEVQDDGELAIGERRVRLREANMQSDMWQMRVLPSLKWLIEALGKYCQSISSLDKDLDAKKALEPILDKLKSCRLDIRALVGRLQNACQALALFLKSKELPSSVRWVELQPLRTVLNVYLVQADLDIARHLQEHLFSKFSTIIMTSATLATGGHFAFMKGQLGIDKGTRKPIESVYPSPFDYETQALLTVPTDLPLPTSPEFTDTAAERIWDAIQASQGNAFVLFTAFSALKACHARLEGRLKEHGYHPLRQGDDERRRLIERFKAQDRSVLFGTDSFWEGVDVAGEALRCVIIVKLPFRVPSDPLTEAKAEFIEEQGGSAFFDYAIPQAIVKFKQGFGRLIRHQEDRGCVVCLDKRLTSKPYGKLFLKSLPPCRQLFASGKEVAIQMESFYTQRG